MFTTQTLTALWQPLGLPSFEALDFNSAVGCMESGGWRGYFVDARILGRTRFDARVAVSLLVAAVTAAALTWILLNGRNPIHFTAPPPA
ncbi:hypothetical protein GGC64_006658 [Mycobacterium sp. OAS707]|uniref:hypothetical protein n=1 Tax=Mycobacterium sp. OAS707 TaxID=2663822 RepID=UPI00178ACC57|nr:hypothetical protein [Mycobacterium sp. OAS707]MBE1552571.1 hypothetical protein [Mycobacterium sp. OAS707]